MISSLVRAHFVVPVSLGTCALCSISLSTCALCHISFSTCTLCGISLSTCALCVFQICHLITSRAILQVTVLLLTHPESSDKIHLLLLIHQIHRSSDPRPCICNCCYVIPMDNYCGNLAVAETIKI